MKSIDALAAEIVAREGGFVHDPDDPGGATNHGVTLATLRRLGVDVTGDGSIDVADVKALTKGQAITILKQHYYHRPRISDLPEALQRSVFDMYVNAGANAISLLQRLLAEFDEPVAVDGEIGPETIAAAARAYRKAPAYLVDAYGISRRNYYYALADRRPASRKFARSRGGGKGGWIKRAEEFVSERFRLSAAEHRARTAAWG